MAEVVENDHYRCIQHGCILVNEDNPNHPRNTLISGLAPDCHDAEMLRNFLILILNIDGFCKTLTKLNYGLSTKVGSELLMLKKVLSRAYTLIF